MEIENGFSKKDVEKMRKQGNAIYVSSCVVWIKEKKRFISCSWNQGLGLFSSCFEIDMTKKEWQKAKENEIFYL